MRVIERKIVQAIQDRKDFKHGQGRDEIEITSEGYEVALWGHVIAERKGTRLELCDCGYATQTTASRINAVCRAEHLPVSYSCGHGGYFRDHDGNEYKSGHIVWDFSKNRIVEE